MFTGLVQAKTTVAAIKRHAFGLTLTVHCPDQTSDESTHAFAHVQPGDSICVSGVCLTVANLTKNLWDFDVITQTLSSTTLGDLAVGDAVNLESAVTPEQPLGGHFMLGHVDGVGKVTRVRHDDQESRLTITPPAELLDFIPPRGSIGIDGVSLTIAAITATTFDVALIPTTLERTTLGSLKVGSRVNLETDILSKTVVHALRRQQSDTPTLPDITIDTLRQAGFIANKGDAVAG